VNKLFAALHLACLGTFSYAELAPEPRAVAGAEKVTVASYQEVFTPDGGKTIIPLGPRVRYAVSSYQMRKNGAMIFDAFEGQLYPGGDPTIPSEGQYNSAAFPNIYGGNAIDGYRWFFGNSFSYTNSVHHIARLATQGKSADGIDLAFRLNPDTTALEHIAIFTYNDALSEVGDPTSAVPPTSPPSSANVGVLFTLATPLDAPHATYPSGRICRFSVDTSSLQSGAGFAMPSGNDGWVQIMFVNQDSPFLLASNVQPAFWGTQGGNPGLAGRWAYCPNGVQVNGTTKFWMDWGGLYAMPVSGTVTRGTGVGSAVDVTKLRGVAGQTVQVTQALQSLLSRNNAEITITCAFPPGAPEGAALNQLRPMLVAKANASPLASSTFSVSLLNTSTSAYDLVYTAPAKNTGADGDWVWTTGPNYNWTAPAAPYSNLGHISSYVATDAGGNQSVNVRVGAKQLLPSLLGWRLTINELFLTLSDKGPINLFPSIAFSSNR